VARRRGFLRNIILRLDRDSAEQVQTDISDALGKAGQSGAERIEEAMQEGGNKAAWQLRRILTESYNKTIAEARVKFARGLIDQREFDRLRHEAARTFDDALIAGMDRLRTQGDLTERQFTSLSRSLKTVGREGPKEVGRISAAFDRLKGIVVGVGGAIAAAFAVRRITQFGRDAIRAAEATRQGQRLLAQQLENVGIAWADVRSEIEATAATLWDTHRMTTDEVDIGLRELIKTTNDYQVSLRYVGLAQDLAAATGSGLEKSAQRIGRVLQGDIGWMRRFGWQAEDSASALALLEERTAGAARASITWGEQVGMAWGDLKTAIGEAMIEAGSGSSVVDTLTGALKGLEEWVRANSSQLSTLTERLLGAAGAAASFAQRVMDVFDPAGEVARKHTAGLMAMGLDSEGWARQADAIGVQIDGLRGHVERLRDELEEPTQETGIAGLIWGFGREKRARAANEQVRETLAQIKSLETTIEGLERTQQFALSRSREQVRVQREELGVVEETLAARIQAQGQEVAQLRTAHGLRVLTAAEMMRAMELEGQIRDQLERSNLALEDRIALAQQLQLIQQVTPDLSVPARARWGLDELEVDLTPMRSARAEVDELAGRWLETNELMVGAAQNAAWGITGAFADMFGELYRGFDGVTGAAEAMARGVAGALLGGVAEYAAGKVKENVALAIEATAKGLAAASNPFTAGLAPGFYQAAKTHALAAAKWGLLAGAGGAGQSAVAGGGRGGLSGGIPTGARDTTGRLLEDRRAPEVHVYIDPLDPSNPAWQRSVYAANRYATDRYGEGATVHVHRYPGGQG